MALKQEMNLAKKEEHENEAKAAKKMSRWIASVLVTVLVFLAVGFGFYLHFSLQPVAKNDQKIVAVEIPEGATNHQIAEILQKKQLIHNATIFDFWLKTQNAANFQAGKFYLSPGMKNAELVKSLQGTGQRPIAGHVLVREGDSIDSIASSVQASTKFTRREFLALMKNKQFIKKLANDYPELLSSSMKKKDVRYHLEGYLFPARYDVYKDGSLKTLVTQMVAKSDQVLRPYYKTIKSEGLTVQKVLTLASLVEREGVKTSDRRKMAGVFFNRFAANMPLQSDVAVMYALNKHKESLTIKDTKVKSPYNLYIHQGYGPGPFNSPSLDSVRAVLNPTDRQQNYLYFVADLKTGKIYYSHTYDEHLNRDASLQN